MDQDLRLFYLDDIPTPYRLDVHRRVAELWPGRYRVGFCAAGEPGRTWDLDFEGLETEILYGWQHRPRRQVNPISLKLNPFVWRSLDRFRPHAVAISGYMQPTAHAAAAWCRWHGVPYATACETSLRSSSLDGFRGWAKRRIAGAMIRNMAFGLPVGAESAEYLTLLGGRPAPMRFFPNTPDASKIASKAEKLRAGGADAAVRRQFGIPAEATLILFIGRMIEAKRPLDLLEAFLAVRDQLGACRVGFVGDGPLLPELKAKAAGDPSVFFPGWISDADTLLALRSTASVMVLPSEHEPWGAVVNEAMAASVPVIASDRVGAAAELIEHGTNGFIFPVGDVARLSQILVASLVNDARLAAVASAARATALANGHDFAATNLVAGALEAVQARAPQTSPATVT